MSDHLHPGAIITILDETLGWAGFFASWQGGVTINISTYFPAPIVPGGSLYSVGYCERTYGTFQRKIAYAQGGFFEKKEGRKRLVAYASGRWLTKPEYKEKMLKYITSYSP
jgi:acyl-coenzyme A thioesterase PaaI-like protein